MPELPEVETSRLGISPHIVGSPVKQVIIRQHRLRWPVPKTLPAKIKNRELTQINRRGKYLLLEFGNSGTVIIHLGMSGSLRICDKNRAVEKHDHVDFVFANENILRYKDPRKFGCILWTAKPVAQHKLLADLGPEPISEMFDASYLYQQSRKRTCSIKALIMNSHIVVGVGNIYACESLFLAGINPKRRAGTLSKQRCEKLADAIKQVLQAAIKAGGTTLRDFVGGDGQPGYFAQELQVYGRAGQSCHECDQQIRQINQQQRSTFYCTTCQK